MGWGRKRERRKKQEIQEFFIRKKETNYPPTKIAFPVVLIVSFERKKNSSEFGNQLWELFSRLARLGMSQLGAESQTNLFTWIQSYKNIRSQSKIQNYRTSNLSLLHPHANCAPKTQHQKITMRPYNSGQISFRHQVLMNCSPKIT